MNLRSLHSLVFNREQIVFNIFRLVKNNWFQTKQNSFGCQIDRKSVCTLESIDFEPNWIPLGVKSIGKVLVRSSLFLDRDLEPNGIRLGVKSIGKVSVRSSLFLDRGQLECMDRCGRRRHSQNGVRGRAQHGNFSSFPRGWLLGNPCGAIKSPPETPRTS